MVHTETPNQGTEKQKIRKDRKKKLDHLAERD